MERKIVSSSNIKSVGYYLGNLEIEFLNRTIYQHYNVPESLYNRLMNSNSKGTFYSQKIKNIYTYKQII